MSIEKAPILRCPLDGTIAEQLTVQRDADHIYYSALITQAKEQARKEERQKMIDEGWISPEECNACNKRQIESERILNREAAFDEERLRDEVKYWKSKNYQLGS
jgi:hypothetical protein